MTGAGGTAPAPHRCLPAAAPASPARQGGMVFTIGHSTHSLADFLALLARHGVTAVADVRSVPFSRFNPQFNRDQLARGLRQAGIAYAGLGSQLGARSADPACFRNGRVCFDSVAQTAPFQAGLARIAKGAETHRIALMCAEKDPLDCHRTILVARRLVEHGLTVRHILACGTLEDHDAALDRLCRQMGLAEGDLFLPAGQLHETALARRAAEIAWRGKAENSGA